MHKKLDGEICCEDTIRWGVWFTILNRMSEDLEAVGGGVGWGHPFGYGGEEPSKEGKESQRVELGVLLACWGAARKPAWLQ